jgi:hypothetical protein
MKSLLDKASYEQLFAVNILLAATNFGLGGINMLFGLVSLCVAGMSWWDWFEQEKRTQRNEK